MPRPKSRVTLTSGGRGRTLPPSKRKRKGGKKSRKPTTPPAPDARSRQKKKRGKKGKGGAIAARSRRRSGMRYPRRRDRSDVEPSRHTHSIEVVTLVGPDGSKRRVRRWCCSNEIVGSA